MSIMTLIEEVKSQYINTSDRASAINEQISQLTIEHEELKKEMAILKDKLESLFAELESAPARVITYMSDFFDEESEKLKEIIQEALEQEQSSAIYDLIQNKEWYQDIYDNFEDFLGQFSNYDIYTLGNINQLDESAPYFYYDETEEDLEYAKSSYDIFDFVSVEQLSFLILNEDGFLIEELPPRTCEAVKDYIITSIGATCPADEA